MTKVDKLKQMISSFENDNRVREYIKIPKLEKHIKSLLEGKIKVKVYGEHKWSNRYNKSFSHIYIWIGEGYKKQLLDFIKKSGRYVLSSDEKIKLDKYLELS